MPVFGLFFTGPSENVRVHSSALRGSRGPLLGPRQKTQLYVVIGVRSGGLFGPNGPGTREGCTFSKSWFLLFLGKSTLSVVFCVPLRAPGPLRASSGGPRGPNNQTKDTASLTPAVRRVLWLRPGGQGSTRPRNTTDSCAESVRRDRCGFRNPRKIRGVLALWHPRGSNSAVKGKFLCFVCAAVSPPNPPRRACAQNLRK